MISRLFLFFVCNCAVFGANATQLTGRVYTDQSQPATGFAVIVQRTVATTNYQTQILTTDSHGMFQANLPEAGTYWVCSGSVIRGFLNSCEWSPSQSTITVSANQANAQIVILLTTGLMLQFRLNDPQNLLPAPGASSGTTGVSFGIVSSDGQFHPAMLASTDNAGQTHQILVPFSASIKLAVRAQNVHVVNQAGTQVDGAPGVALPSFQSQPTASVQFQKFTVVPQN